MVLKALLSSLDLTNESYSNIEAYATELGSSLKPNSKIIINGEMVLSKLDFQKKWLMTPLTFHQLNNFDCHLIPGTTSYIINITGKVKFDESGKNRLGETADLITTNTLNAKRSLWSSWFGFYLNLVIDQPGAIREIINSFNYRITFKPHDSIISI